MVNHCNSHSSTSAHNMYSKNLSNFPFAVFHQNVRTDRYNYSHTPPPHVLCLTEHHCKEQEIESLAIDHYRLGAKFCRHKLKQGDTCIFVHESLTFSNINLQEFCLDQDIETCAVTITSLSTRIVVICIYRSPSGNFTVY
jgi:hypothetical protein